MTEPVEFIPAELDPLFRVRIRINGILRWGRICSRNCRIVGGRVLNFYELEYWYPHLYLWIPVSTDPGIHRNDFNTRLVWTPNLPNILYQWR